MSVQNLTSELEPEKEGIQRPGLREAEAEPALGRQLVYVPALVLQDWGLPLADTGLGAAGPPHSRVSSGGHRKWRRRIRL